MPPRRVQRSLAALERKGFITHSPEQAPRYFAAPPDVAVEALLARRQSEARAAITELRECSRAADERDAEERIVEVLNHEAAVQVFQQVVRSADREILCLERLPALVSVIDRPDEAQLQRLAKGVRFRAITDSGLLNVPGSLNRLRIATQAGEQYRIYPSLPFKLVVSDRRIGLIPLNLARPDGPVLLVRSSSLLDALCEMFEMLWRAALPFALDHTDMSRQHFPVQHSAGSADALLPLLASGLNDKTIEHELGISHRTLARRIGELMKRLGAATRFQAGWLAAQAARDAESSQAPG